MLAEIAVDALGHFDRATLEGMQMHSRYLRDLIGRHAGTLPLRCIHHVEASILWGSLQVTKSPSDQRIMLLAPDAADLETLFHRVKNAFIHRLEFNFLQENVHHLHYLRSKADNLHCRIGSLRIQGSAVEIDYDVVDFLGVHLKPQIYAISMLGQLREEYVTLFAHTAMRASVKHLAYERASSQMFEAAERGTDIVRSVTLLHVRYYNVSPSYHSAVSLGVPQRIDGPTPPIAFIMEWARKDHGSTTTEATVTELYEFENAKSAKKLKVFVWNVEQVQNASHLRSVHYAFQLQVVDI